MQEYAVGMSAGSPYSVIKKETECSLQNCDVFHGSKHTVDK